MKKFIIGLALVSTLSLSLVSCRSMNTADGMYGYYNGRATDREYNERMDNVPNSTKNRIKDSYNKAKNNVKNTVDSTANYIGNAMGVR